MFEPRPPRADPRLLVVDVARTAVHVAVVDAWEIRALDTLPRGHKALALALWRLITKARPSHVLVRRDRPFRSWPGQTTLARLAVERGLPLGHVAHDEAHELVARAPTFTELASSYPELRHLRRRARDPRVGTLRLAVAALSTRSLPPRRYVPGLSSHAPTDMAS